MKSSGPASSLVEREAEWRTLEAGAPDDGKAAFCVPPPIAKTRTLRDRRRSTRSSQPAPAPIYVTALGTQHVGAVRSARGRAGQSGRPACSDRNALIAKSDLRLGLQDQECSLYNRTPAERGVSQ